MNIEQFIQQHVSRCIESLYGDTGGAPVQIQKTRKEFEGDMTLVVFPLLKLSRKSPEATAEEIGSALVGAVPEISGYNVVKGFLNISLSPRFWAERLNEILSTPGYGRRAANGRTVMVEYSSPNTNKPLHLGHVRNNLLGYSVSLILEAAGYRVIKVNLVNDRGIHICKSMLAWQKFGRGETPASSGKKGDHLVGDYYVAFDKAYKAEVKELTAAGMSEEEAKREAPIMREAQQMLRRWEAKDPEVYSLWETMNGWVYEGFDKTYEAMGVGFDKVYYESQTYLLGKSIVEEGLAKGVFYRRDDGSVWCDLTSDGLDEKLLLRGDGTSVYMTQDLGTALTRFREEKLDEMIYVVGNEQNYHFQVLKLILGKLGYAWADHITHLSYGMVELPEGKMKSREGTVVDADDLIDEMVRTAREMSQELGKFDDMSEQETALISRTVGLGALKYFILKVDPRKTMLFDPRESIDFNGNTGPFIQYTYARIRSVLRKAAERGIAPAERLHDGIVLSPDEVIQAAENFSPAVIANYLYELSKQYNGYYHDIPILRESDPTVQAVRLRLSQTVAEVIASGAGLLGINVPERM